MTHRSHFLSPEIDDYILSVSLREHPVLKELRQVTLAHQPAYEMMIGPDQGQFLALLIKLMDAKRTIDIGTFTGYSALSVALALPDNGEVITCDSNEKTTQVAKQFWKKAEVEHKIQLKIGPAINTLNALLDAGLDNQFDFVFIDADKKNNIHYYEKSLLLVKPGGLIAIDNVLWHGRVLDPNDQDKLTPDIRHFNEMLFHDQRVDLSMLSMGDGLTLARRRVVHPSPTHLGNE